MKFKTAIDITVELTSARRRHIIETHPVMEAYLSKLREVLAKPEDVRRSSRADDVLLFYRFFDNIENGKYIAVVVNVLENSVKTSYLTHRIKEGRIYEKE